MVYCYFIKTQSTYCFLASRWLFTPIIFHFLTFTLDTNTFSRLEQLGNGKGLLQRKNEEFRLAELNGRTLEIYSC